jgi:hypothetical protein
MPFGMGPAGWLMVPYIYPYLTNFYTYWGYYSPWYFGYGYPFPDELTYLKQIKQNLEMQLQNINARIQELEVQ